jgi:pyruvate dehydrogenase E2 component (dihydrolipoamide acetyltransferase)
VERAGQVLATPATRKLARDLAVDIRAVPGTGPGGRITSDDVRGHQSSAARGAGAQGGAGGGAGASAATTASLSRPGAEPGDVRIPFRGVRKKIAERLVHSKHTAAHFTYVEEVDCTELVALRARANERLAARGTKLSYLPFIIKATVGALQKFPQLNATLDEVASEIVQRAAHHIGLATATDSGLIVPVVRNAGGMSLVRLAAEIERLAEATRSGKATREELSGSTFTITSLGALGGLLATPIINHPEVAILGIHRIRPTPVARDGQVVIRDVMHVSVTSDHRVVDGHEAAAFAYDVIRLLEDPNLLFMRMV